MPGLNDFPLTEPVPVPVVTPLIEYFTAEPAGVIDGSILVTIAEQVPASVFTNWSATQLNATQFCGATVIVCEPLHP